MTVNQKPLVWLKGEVKTPPFSKQARLEAGILLRKLQAGEVLSMPHCRPMPSIASRCHELRIQSDSENWRLIFRTDKDAIIILEVFNKKSNQTPKRVIDNCVKRLNGYDEMISK